MATEIQAAGARIPREMLRLLTVSDYERMAEAGIIDDEDRIELICGEILKMVPIGDRHNATVARLDDLLRVNLEGSIVWVQGSIRLSGNSEPQPDVCLVKRRDDYYSLGKPGPADIQLIVEVSESSLTYDRTFKLPLYAQAGIPEVWIANLIDGVVEVNTRPLEAAYTQQVSLSRSDFLSPLAFPTVRVAVNDVLGPPISSATA